MRRIKLLSHLSLLAIVFLFSNLHSKAQKTYSPLPDSTVYSPKPTYDSILYEFKILDGKADEIIKILEDNDEGDKAANWATAGIALLAVVVSCFSAYMNFSAFKGQSITNFRKQWNDSVISLLTEFINISTEVFLCLQDGKKPDHFQSSMTQIQKIATTIKLKLAEIDLLDKENSNALTDIILSISKFAQNENHINGDDFIQKLKSIETQFSAIFKSNWDIIKRF